MKCSVLEKAVSDLLDGENIKSRSSFLTSVDLALSLLTRRIPPLHRAVLSLPYVGSGVTTDEARHITIIRLDELYGDYISLDRCPTDDTGAYIADCMTVGDRVILRSDYKGDIVFIYRRKITLPDMDTVTNDGDIDVEESCEDFMTLLTAYYLSLYDEPEKAKRFMSLFDYYCPAEILRRQRIPTCDLVTSIKGW